MSQLGIDSCIPYHMGVMVGQKTYYFPQMQLSSLLILVLSLSFEFEVEFLLSFHCEKSQHIGGPELDTAVGYDCSPLFRWYPYLSSPK